MFIELKVKYGVFLITDFKLNLLNINILFHQRTQSSTQKNRNNFTTLIPFLFLNITLKKSFKYMYGRLQ